MGKYFEDFEIGDVSTSAGRTITETDIVNFAALTGDWNEIHTNKELAARGSFGQRIAHGALVFSVATGLSVRMGQTNDTVSKWNDGHLVTTWTSNGAIAGTKIVRTETRSLSADGKTMTVESTRGSTAPIVMVFDKK